MAATPSAEEPKKKTGVEDFEFGKVLGEGSFGDVLLCTHKVSGDRFAAKKIEKQHLIKTGNTKYAVSEREVLTTCQHPNIIKLFYSFRDDTCLYYILELAPKGELRKLIKKKGNLNLASTRFFAAELVVALEYLHMKAKIIHRDLKPENVLLSDSLHIKLTDFGTAKRLKEGEDRVRTASFLGTAEYIAPECLDEEPLVCRASDLWALGCIIYQMLTGSPPFHGDTQFLTFELVKAGKVSFTPHFPYQARLLIERLLSIDPDARPSYQELKDHPFFAGIDWNNLDKISIADSVAPEPEYQVRKLHKSLFATEGPMSFEGDRVYEYGPATMTGEQAKGKLTGTLVLTATKLLFIYGHKRDPNVMHWPINAGASIQNNAERERSFTFSQGPTSSPFFDDSDFDPARWRRALRKVVKRL